MKKRTRIGISLCAGMLMMAMLMTACAKGGAEGQTTASGTASQAPSSTAITTSGGSEGQPTADATKTAEEIVGEIYSQLKGNVEFPSLENRSLDLGDAEAFRYIFGIDPPASAKDAEVSEPIIGSLPYTLAVLTLKDKADIQRIADAIQAGVNPSKWICVTATVVDVVVKDNAILLIMDSDVQRAGAVKSAFQNIDI